MEQQQLRLMGILGVVLLGLAAGVFLWEPAKDENNWDPTATEEVWSVEEGAVSQVTIRGGEVPLVIEKVDDEWLIRAPRELRADGYRVSRFLKGLSLVQKGIPIAGVSPKDYGLEPPRYEIELRAESGVQTLKIGRDTAVDDRFYALSAKGEVVAVGGGLTRELEVQDLDWFRSSELLRFDRGAVSKVVLASPEGVLDLQRRDGIWWLEGFTRAEPDKVQELLMAALSLRFDAFIEPFEGPIAAPRYTLEITLSGEDGDEVRRVRVGDETPEGVVVEVEGLAAGFVKAGPLAFLGQGPRDVGDPRAFPVDLAMIDRVDLRRGAVVRPLRREEDAWKGEEVDAAALGAALEVARIQYRRDPVAPIAEVWGEIAGYSADQQRWSVQIGEQRGENRVMRDGRGGAPYLVPEADLSALFAALP